MPAQEDQLHTQLSEFVTCTLYTGVDRPAQLLHRPGQHCHSYCPLYRVQLSSILLSVCLTCMLWAKPRRLPGGWVPTVTTTPSKAEVHRIVVIGMVASLHRDMQELNLFLEPWQMCRTFGHGPESGLLCMAGTAPESILGRLHSCH